MKLIARKSLSFIYSFFFEKEKASMEIIFLVDFVEVNVYLCAKFALIRLVMANVH